MVTNKRTQFAWALLDPKASVMRFGSVLKTWLQNPPTDIMNLLEKQPAHHGSNKGVPVLRCNQGLGVACYNIYKQSFP